MITTARRCLLLLVSMACTGLIAQTPAAAPAQPPVRVASVADTLQTVTVGADDRVTFKFFAPKASAVTVTGDFRMGAPAATLTKGDDGVWSYTSGVLPRDSYTYNFTVDGVGVLYTKSANFRDNPNSLFNFFDMPGPETDFEALKNVPHGRVELVTYHSGSLNMERRVHVYLPPHFETLKAGLPVLYLLHGYGDNDISWTSAGKVNLILDNLYAEGKLRNMIVVMPAGHIPGQTNRMMQFSTGLDSDAFSKDFQQDLMPFIEKTYNVSTKREDTAIAGFSMGGVQTLNLALGHPDRFGYVVAMSTGYRPDSIASIEDKYGPVFQNVAQHPFKLFLIGKGKDDAFLAPNSNATMKMFDKYGIVYHYQELNGAHSFVFSRRYLALAFPQLFR